MSWNEWDDYPEPAEPPWYVGVFIIILLILVGICAYLFMTQKFEGVEAVKMESKAIDISEVSDAPSKPDRSRLTDNEINEILNNPNIPEYHKYEALQEDYIPPQERTKVEPIEAQNTEWTADNFKQAGVLYYDGVRYTWYSEKILPGGGLTELNSNGRTVSAEGYIIDKDGFIACASSDYPIGTELWTPLGNVKVYDTGCAFGTIDIYTSW